VALGLGELPGYPLGLLDLGGRQDAPSLNRDVLVTCGTYTRPGVP